MEQDKKDLEGAKKYSEAEFKARLLADRANSREEYAEDRKLQADKAKQDSLAAEAKWKELSEMHSTEVDRLKPFEAKAKQFDEWLEAQLKKATKDLGDVAKKAYKALPESMSTSDRLKYLEDSGLLQAETNQVLGTPLGKQKKAGGKADPRATHKRLRL